MAPRTDALEWSLVQAFLAVAEHGSLSAAARALGLTQPTLGRQIRALEQQLDAELFRRHDKGLALTPLGTSLVASAESMREAAHAIELRAAGKGKALEGAVRVTASFVVAQHHLPRIVARIRTEEPRISIDVVPSDATTNLHFREADIAIRMYRPEQLDLVTHHVGDLSFGAFASRGYLERRGAPASAEGLLAHDFVGMDRSPLIIEGFRAAGLEVTRDFFRTRTDDTATYWALVRAGCGIGFAQRSIARSEPDVVEVPLPFPLPKLPVWLTAHAAVHRTPRVRRVWTLLASGLAEVVDPGTSPARTPGTRRGRS